MTEKNIRHEFNKADKEIEQAIQTEIRRLRYMGFSKAYNDVAIMDNATFHKTPDLRRIIEATGATLLYLPPYSPDLDPIEHDFAALERIREYNHSKTLDEIINSYQ